MRRYQVYLDPHSVSILDEFEKYANISRSKLIREAIDRLAQNLSRVFVEKNEAPRETITLDSLVGFINVADKKQTNYASRNDSAYLTD
ncbi:MAG: hypothetical protein Q7R77_02430 [Candidatus Daviesbacteria bacterium]|nr:hypothetical protein [Candidatus Daviesbacteria bacterium]